MREHDLVLQQIVFGDGKGSVPEVSFETMLRRIVGNGVGGGMSVHETAVAEAAVQRTLAIICVMSCNGRSSLSSNDASHSSVPSSWRWIMCGALMNLTPRASSSSFAAWISVWRARR